MLSCFSHVQLFAPLWTVACQALLQEHWSGLPCPPPGDLPGSRPVSASWEAPRRLSDVKWSENKVPLSFQSMLRVKPELFSGDLIPLREAAFQQKGMISLWGEVEKTATFFIMFPFSECHISYPLKRHQTPVLRNMREQMLGSQKLRSILRSKTV